VLLVAMLIFGCVSSSPEKENNKIKVVASFYPLYDFAKNVGGERVEIVTLIPSGVEPHEFEPSPGDIKAISGADVLVYNGAGMEPWMANLLESNNNQKLIVVDTTQGVTLLKADGHEAEHHEHEAEHHHGEYDPHTWLNPIIAKQQVVAITDALIKADPAGKEYYESNSKTYLEKLDSLDSEISASMSNCKKKDILITHATLGYFCDRYGCNQIAISGINPEAEPSAQDVAKIVDEAKEHNVSVVFFEKLINPKTAQTISNEIGGSTMTFNTVHGLTKEEEALGMDYISLMENNLYNIKMALSCD